MPEENGVEGTLKKFKALVADKSKASGELTYDELEVFGRLYSGSCIDGEKPV